ncbi:MAG: hypothetical protein QFB87_00160 [Patescibacteria group bacterium]|nr:hypothetical protein [Patescibacteria group bacterium]
MTAFDANRFGPDEMFLSGRLQVDTAINVLEITEACPDAVSSLRALQRAHELSDSDTETMDDLKAHFRGGSTAEFKSAIITSALLAEQNQTLSEDKRIAATGLLAVLGVEK